MDTADFFRSRLDAMIDMRHPLVVLTAQFPWGGIEAALAPNFAHQDRTPKEQRTADYWVNTQCNLAVVSVPQVAPVYPCA